MTDQQPARLRESPRERFAKSEMHFSLDDAFDVLPDESVERQGHMQKAIYRHGPCTTAIFSFEPGSGLDQHSVEGEAILHLLEGRMIVQTAEKKYDLKPNDVLLLDPGVPHDIRAGEPSRLLMHMIVNRK